MNGPKRYGAGFPPSILQTIGLLSLNYIIVLQLAPSVHFRSLLCVDCVRLLGRRQVFPQTDLIQSSGAPPSVHT